MIRIGDYNKLEIVSVGKTGAVASDGSTDVRVPLAQCDESVITGAMLNLFVYRNSKDQVVATTKKPKGKVGDFAALRVVSVTSSGAFLNWGLEKDLFVPHSQMLGRMQEGYTYVVRIITDTVSKRIIGTPRLRPFLKSANPLEMPIGTKVTALVYETRDTGTMAVINNEFQAMFPRNEFTKRPHIGTSLDAYVKQFDEQGRITISRAPVGRSGWSGAEGSLMSLLQQNDGSLPVNDHSSPEEINDVTGLSKKSFKKVVGGLLKKRIITITETGISLIEE